MDMEEIKDISQIRKYTGKHVYIEVEWNSYLSGYRFVYAKKSTQVFQDGSVGFSAACEVKSNGVHSNYAITTRDMERGYVRIREASEEEWKPRKFSYNSDGRGW